jgi:hypothetical protein
VGVLAQLVERLVRNEKVRGSNPLGSTSFPSAGRSGISARDARIASNRPVHHGTTLRSSGRFGAPKFFARMENFPSFSKSMACKKSFLRKFASRKNLFDARTLLFLGCPDNSGVTRQELRDRFQGGDKSNAGEQT